MLTNKMTRRDFFRMISAAGVLTIPVLVGYDMVQDAKGESPPQVSPFAQIEPLNSWPTNLEGTSPILVLINQNGDNPFGLYLTEILRAEGLNCFQIASVTDLDSAPLHWFDSVLLAEGPLGKTKVERLEDYVAKGGNLVAMRPDPHLASLLGLEPAAGTITEGYIQVETDHPIGRGVTTETLQFHGTAGQYRLAGAQAIAWLATTSNSLSQFPAVTIHQFGQGQAVAWAFDLAKNIAYTRQGNPVWVDQDRDGLNFVRCADMFKGWVDLDRLAIPQADQHQRLLVNLLATLSQYAQRPLPRLWYFPEAVEGLVVATGDAHPVSKAPAIEKTLRLVEERNGHMSIYYSPILNQDLWRTARSVRFRLTDLPLVGNSLANRYQSPIPSQISSWRARGHEFTLHPHVGAGVCGGYASSGIVDFNDVEAGWERYWQEFTGLGYGPISPTVRTHCILWQGWVNAAHIQAGYGMKMNLDYYHVGPAFRKENGEWMYGHFTGSGLPMKFIDEQGRILNIYQQLTQLTDEHLLNWPELGWKGQVKLDAEASVKVSELVMEQTLAGDYNAVIGVNFHTDPFAYPGRPADEATRWLEGTLDYAVAHGMPIWSAAEWLHFTEVRHDANFQEIRWHPEGQQLSFQLAASEAPNVTLSVMIPLRHGEAQLTQISVDGGVTKHSIRTVGNVDYGWVTIPAGSHQVIAKYT